MRTTININDQLLQQAGLRAAATHQTITAVIEDALRRAISDKPGTVASQPACLHTDGSGGLLPGVDLEDMPSLLDLMEDRA